MSRRRHPLTPNQVDLLSRVAVTSGEGVTVEGYEAISAQSLKRRGWVKFAQRSHDGSTARYLLVITPEGREELALHTQYAKRGA